MAFVLPPSVASGLATAGSVGLQALPGLAVLGIGFTTIKLLEHKPTKWEKTKSVVEDVGKVLAVMTAVGTFINAVRGQKAGQKTVSEEDINAAVESRAKELFAQQKAFDAAVSSVVDAERQQLTVILEQERAAMNTKINQAVSEALAAASVPESLDDMGDPDEVVEVPVAIHKGTAAKINRKRGPVVRKAAGQ